MTAASRSTRTVVLTVALAALAIAAIFAVRALVRAEEPLAAPSPLPLVSPTPTPPPQPEPFEVTLRSTRSQTTGNGRIFSNRAEGKRTKAVGRAGRRATRALQRYLNAAFVDPTTRFSSDALDGVFTPRARDTMRKRDRHALAVGLAPIDGGTTRKATARAIVLHDGGEVYAVTVVYRAAMDVIVGDAEPQRLRQRGSMVFIRTANGWRADMADVRLQLPDGVTGAET